MDDERGPRVVLDGESVEFFRAEMRPLLDRVRAFFGWEAVPLVTARSLVGDFFEWIRDAEEFRATFARFAATLPFPVAPADRALDVARKLT